MRADQRRSLHRTMLTAAVLLTFGLCRGRSDHVLRPGRSITSAKEHGAATPRRSTMPKATLSAAPSPRRAVLPTFWSRRLIPGHLEPHRRHAKTFMIALAAIRVP